MCAKSLLLLLYFHVLFLKLVNSTLAHFVQIKFAYDFSACMIQNFCCVVSDIYTHMCRHGGQSLLTLSLRVQLWTLPSA